VPLIGTGSGGPLPRTWEDAPDQGARDGLGPADQVRGDELQHMALESYDCEICLYRKEEKLRHVFFRCLFAKNCWCSIGANVPTWLKPKIVVKNIKRQLKLPFAMESYNSNVLEYLERTKLLAIQ
jgi:hypothetical protein